MLRSSFLVLGLGVAGCASQTSTSNAASEQALAEPTLIASTPDDVRDLTVVGDQLWFRSLQEKTISGWRYQLRKVDLATKVVTSPAPSIDWADSLAFDGTNLRTVAYDASVPVTSVLNDGQMTLFSLDPATGAATPSSFGFMSGLISPHIRASVADAHGNLFLAIDDRTLDIVRIAADGTRTSWTIEDQAINDDVGGLALDADNNVYFTRSAWSGGAFNAVSKLDPRTGSIEVLAGPYDGTFEGCRGIVFDGKGHLLIADSNHDAIDELDLATREVNVAFKLNHPTAMTLANGTLYVESDRAILASRLPSE